jgi:hypothetical protein
MSSETIDRQQVTSPSSDPKTINRARFELELEFIQSLANPHYLHSLAQQNILEQPAFINFLKYLLYFKEKDYARFIQLDLVIIYLRMLALLITCACAVIRTRCITLTCFNMRSFGPK